MKSLTMKKILGKGGLLLVMVLLVFSMCACSREESGTTADRETGLDDGGVQAGPANGNDDAGAQAGLENRNDDGSETDTAEAINLFIVEPVMPLDVTATAAESQNVIDTISRLPVSDLEAAVTYTMNSGTPFLDDCVVLLCQSETGKTSIYGYESDAYGSRGIILGFNDTYSYYDFMWSRDWGRMDVYEQDFDQDGVAEPVFCFGGARGTGISTERLVVFDDIRGDETLAAYEFTPEMQMEQFEQNIMFTMDLEEKKLIITKDGQTAKSIDWKEYGNETVEDTIGIDCLNQIWFEINGDEIRMGTDIGILFNVVGGPSQFVEDGEFYLDIVYSNGTFQIQ